jgi:SAM-dependent methyltransferase
MEDQMANWLTAITQRFVDLTDRVLVVCSGVGNVEDGIKCRVMVAVDIFEPYLHRFHEKRPDIIPIKMNAADLGEHFLPDTFDVVVCLDGIEHLERLDANLLMKNMESIAKKRVIIFTTDGYAVNEPHDAWDIQGGDDFQRHRCGISRSEFERMGYEAQVVQSKQNQFDGTPCDMIFCVKSKAAVEHKRLQFTLCSQ